MWTEWDDMMMGNGGGMLAGRVDSRPVTRSSFAGPLQQGIGIIFFLKKGKKKKGRRGGTEKKC